MSKQRLLISMVIVLVIICQTLMVMAAPVSKAGAGTVYEHPVIKPIPGSVFRPGPTYSENLNYHAYKFEIGAAMYEEVAGPYWKLSYYFPGSDGKPDKNISPVEILENFRRAALASNGEILRKSTYRLNFKVIDNGKTYWVQVAAGHGNGQYRLHIIEQADFNQTLAFDANAMKSELDSTGRVTIHDIKFGYDQAAILPGSEAVLSEIVRLLQGDPAMRIEVQGYTDNQGDRWYNVELSKRRADAVRDYLIGAGINPYRLETKGLGPDFPIASNNTEEGRSQNRRVELKKIL